MDQLGAMRAFVRVVQTGSFSATGREMNTTQTTISKKVAALENKLGVRLLTRTSRELALTLVGAEYYEKCVMILGEVDEAEAQARSEIAMPRGVLRIAAPVALGRLVIAPLMAEFFSLYPEIKVDLSLNDRHVDLVGEGVDMAIRAKKLEDSSLVARHLIDNPMYLLASPEYLAKFGELQCPDDLHSHNCLVYSMLKSINIWHFSRDAQEYSVPVSGNFQSDNGDVLLEVALRGLGLVQLPLWMVADDVSAGRLKIVLPEYSGQTLPINAIYPQNRYVPLKVRCFIDFLKHKLSTNPVYQ